MTGCITSTAHLLHNVTVSVGHPSLADPMDRPTDRPRPPHRSSDVMVGRSVGSEGVPIACHCPNLGSFSAPSGLPLSLPPSLPPRRPRPPLFFILRFVPRCVIAVTGCPRRFSERNGSNVTKPRGGMTTVAFSGRPTDWPIDRPTDRPRFLGEGGERRSVPLGRGK